MPGFDPDQPRDEKGQWTAAGSSEAIKAAAGDKIIYNPETGERYIESEKKKIPAVVTNEEEGNKAITDFVIDKAKPEEVEAMKAYTGSEYYDINKALRMDREDLIKFHDRVIKNLDSFLNEAPKFNGVSFRGLSFGNENGYNSFKNDVTDDSIIMDNAFGSTTLDPNKPKTFTGDLTPFAVFIKIKGKSGVYLGKQANYGDMEKEVLFPRKTKFKVNDVKEEQEDLPPAYQFSYTKRKVLKLELEEL